MGISRDAPGIVPADSATYTCGRWIAQVVRTDLAVGIVGNCLALAAGPSPARELAFGIAGDGAGDLLDPVERVVNA